MFSTGSGSHDGQNYPTQWALNPSAYQNVANDQVDWAALAQQWIMMKETAPPEHQVPQAPPPPNIGSKKEIIDEGGEAPMDVDDKDESEWNDSVGAGGQDWNWQQNWSWSGNWNGPSGVPPPNSVNSSNKSALLPTPFSHYATQNLETNSNLDYQTAPPNDFNSGYWTNNSGGSRNKGPSKQRLTRKGPMASDSRLENSSESVTLDAAKRRQLPAWIREGLEKMEREKQKQLERERERVEREVYLSRKKEETEGAIKFLQASGLPEKSKFDSDSEDSSSEREQKSKKTPSPARSYSPPPLSEEERMQQRMLMVRRAMTEVLLQVTSSEIEMICQEELSRFRARNTASAKKMARYGTPSEGSISGSLGLGMYGGETDSSSDDSESDHQPTSINNDSDTQLKETIRRRRAEFAKTERDIEIRLNKDKDLKTAGDKSDGGQTPEWPDSGGERDHSQVDTAQPHGSGCLKSRRHSQKSTSRTPPRKDQKTSPDPRDMRKKIKKPKQSSSSSNSDSEESSASDSTSSTSSQDTRHKQSRLSRRGRSRSTETDKSRKKGHHSRSVSNPSDSDDRSHSRRDSIRSYSSRRSDRSRRERESRRERSRSRSRHRRSRSRSRDRGPRSRRTKSRSRSRSRRRRSRSHSERQRGHRSPHGGYQLSDSSSHRGRYQRNNI